VVEGILDYAPVGIYQIKPTGVIHYANRQMANLFGYEDPGTFIASIPNVQQVYANPLERKEILNLLMSSEVVTDVEFQLVRKDLTPFWARFTTRVVRDPSGEVLYFEGFISDISARKQAERELRASLEAQEKYRRELEAVRTGDRWSASPRLGRSRPEVVLAPKCQARCFSHTSGEDVLSALEP